ncbi:unnamed protein product [Durusdinium trenchii]|uniref:Centrosomal protein of 162 kDa n=1 Tax=Durusdinium trenchii TaxID=1381693 RepID=A0ABP0JQJ9_9DINO
MPDGEASGSEPTVYADKGYMDDYDVCGQTGWTTLPQLSGRSVSPRPTRPARSDLSKLDHIIQQAKEVQDQLLSSVRVTAPQVPSSVAEPITMAAATGSSAIVPPSVPGNAPGGPWAFSTPVRRSREGKTPRSKLEESSRVRRAADELLESVRRRALEAEIERLRGELAAAEASKQKLQAGESAEAEAGAEATRLLREARVEVNRLKAALQRQGHFDRIKEAESHRKAFEQELRTAREDAARKHEELQHLNQVDMPLLWSQLSRVHPDWTHTSRLSAQVQQEQLVKERDAERRLRLEAETRREAILLKLREMEEAERLRQNAEGLLNELREEIRQLQGVLHVEQLARQAAEQRQSAVEGLHQRSQQENAQLRKSVTALAQQEKQKFEELLDTERSLRQSAEEQCRKLQADLSRCLKELETNVQDKKVELEARQAAELRSKTVEESCLQLRNEKLKLEAQIHELELQLDAKGASSEHLRTQLARLQADEERWVQERTRLEAQMRSQATDMHSRTADMESLQQKLEREGEVSQRQLEQAKQEQASLKRQLDEAKATLSDFDGRQQRLSKERDDALLQVREVQAKLEQQQNEATATLSDFDGRQQRLSKERDDALLQVREVQAKLEQQQNEVLRLSTELSDARAQSVPKSGLEEMQRLMDSLQKERDTLQADVEHYKQAISERRKAESSLRAALQEEQNNGRILHQELEEVKRIRSLSAASQEGMSPEPSPRPQAAGTPGRASITDSDVHTLVQKIRRSEITTSLSKDMGEVDLTGTAFARRDKKEDASSYETISVSEDQVIDLKGVSQA